MKKIVALVVLVLSFNLLLTAQDSYDNLTISTIDTDQLPIRDVRKVALWLNMGWNGLVGVGPVVSYYPVPKIAIDAGLGLSGVGLKLSGRARYLFSVKNFTTFAGAGFMYGSGSGVDFEQKDSFNNNATYRVMVDNSYFVQLVGGFEYMAKKGFFTLFDVGYALVLNDNYYVTSGSPSPNAKKAMRISFGSGIVIEGGIGYAF